MNMQRVSLGRGGGGGGRGGARAGARKAAAAAKRQDESTADRWESQTEEDGEEEGEDVGALGRKKPSHRDFAFPEPTGGRYVYRQYDDGSILIVEGPKGPYPKGKEPPVLRRATPNPRAWLAINTVIEAHKAGKRAETIALLAQIAVAASTVVVALVAPPHRRHKKRGRDPLMVDQPIVEKPKFPWLLAAAGAVVVVGGIALASR